MKLLACATLLAALGCAAPRTEPEWGRPLPYGTAALLPLGPGEEHPSIGHFWLERTSLRPPLERSLHWMHKPSSVDRFPMAGISYERALRSLERFSQLLDEAQGPDEFERAIESEFRWYKSAGWDGQGGGVLFTAYCTPILEGSLTADDTYRYPLYALPPDLVKASDGTILGRRTDDGLEPYPARRVIDAGFLRGKGLELCYLRDPLDAFIAHVNGSAVVRLPDGREAHFGYAGKNGRVYTSLGQELVRAGEIAPEELSLTAIRAWAARNPGRIEDYLARNDAYVFFQPIEGNPHGSLDEEVTPGRSLATDKSLFPPAAICYVDTTLPLERGRVPFRQLMFDQDTGGAIRTAGRADIYLGMGSEAERRAGATRSQGQLYYLFLAP